MDCCSNNNGDVMWERSISTTDPATLLERLRDYAFLKDYHLLLFSTTGGTATSCRPAWKLRLAYEASHRHGELPVTAFDEILEIACMGNRPTTIRSREGLYLFAVPFSLSGDSIFCLVGIGVRDSALDLEGVEALAGLTGRNPVELLESLQQYPAVEKKDVEKTAERVSRLIKESSEGTSELEPGEDVLDKLAAIVGVCAEIDKMPTCGAAVSLFLDTLTIIFDIPSLGVVFTGNACQQLFLTKDWTPPPAVVTKVIPHRIYSIFPPDLIGKTFVLGGEIASIFSEHHGESATCLQFLADGDDCGLVTFLDTKLQEGDVSLVELVCSRTANRIQQLLQAEQLLRANTQSQKMLEVIGSMLKIEDHNELYDSLLNTATGLVGAVSGSFMLMDKNGEDLRIEAAKGINSHLARSFTIKVGEGIAGKAAAGASPLLISDIENDARTARLNRSRFRTKSCVSLPFSFNRKVIGVLNLADKENGATFDDKDLETLTYFADHLAGVVHHAKAKAAWKNCRGTKAVDPFTGLYSRDLLHKRMREEISRCKRQERSVGLMRIELLNSGGAGDEARQIIAEVLKGMLRETDVISRYGENSFCAMLADTGKHQSRQVGERVRAKIIGALARQNGSVSPDACITLGLSSFPEDGKNIDDLMRAAENDVFSPTSGNPIAAKPLPLPLSCTTSGDRDLLGHNITLRDPRQLLPLFHSLPDMDSQPGARPVPPPYSGSPSDRSERLK